MKKLLIITILGLIYSCKGETYKNWSVSNESNEEIIVSYRDISNNELKTFTISSNNNETINSVKLKGIVQEKGNPALALKDFQIINTSGQTCTKNYTITSNWLILQEKKSPPSRNYIYYSFNVDDTNF